MIVLVQKSALIPIVIDLKDLTRKGLNQAMHLQELERIVLDKMGIVPHLESHWAYMRLAQFMKVYMVSEQGD